jgi:glycine cleavage system protein P-like pyridoxal-binding family
MKMKNSSDTIGNRTRELPARSAVPQPTAPTRAPNNNNNSNNNNKVIPVITGATGTISKAFRKYVINMPGNHEVKELQKTAILGTAYVLRKVLT